LEKSDFCNVAKNIDYVFLKNFGSNLKRIREEHHFTQAQLAIDCDFDVSVISRIERGAVNTSLHNLKMIADALSIEIFDLFVFAE